MSLEEQFESDGNYCDNQIYTYGCIKIAEKFAIEFQEWLIQNCTLCLKIWTYKKDESKIYEISELMEIFRKEKEL